MLTVTLMILAVWSIVSLVVGVALGGVFRRLDALARGPVSEPGWASPGGGARRRPTGSTRAASQSLVAR
jgi:hypothetical protein